MTSRVQEHLKTTNKQLSILCPSLCLYSHNQSSCVEWWRVKLPAAAKSFAPRKNRKCALCFVNHPRSCWIARRKRSQSLLIAVSPTRGRDWTLTHCSRCQGIILSRPRDWARGGAMLEWNWTRGTQITIVSLRDSVRLAGEMSSRCAGFQEEKLNMRWAMLLVHDSVDKLYCVRYINQPYSQIEKNKLPRD